MDYKISVALCTYNGAKYLAQQLESVLTQSQGVEELIICDDGSTDGTLEIIRRFQEQYPQHAIKIYENESQLGAVKNFEKAIALTTGNYIFLSDQDDVWEPNKVERMLAYFQSHPQCCLLFTNASLMDENSTPLTGSLWEQWGFDKEQQDQWQNQSYQIQALIQNQNKITGATVGFRTALKAEVLPMDLPYKMWHDCFLGLMAAKQNGLHFLDQKLIRYRIHKQQQVGIKETRSYPREHCVTQEAFRERLKRDFEAYLSYYDQKYQRKNNTKAKLGSYIRRLLGKLWSF